jgi:hypothetical protein
MNLQILIRSAERAIATLDSAQAPALLAARLYVARRSSCRD